MPKSSKRFILSDESVNRYGFRVLTSGIDLGQFRKNPVCYYLHMRGGEEVHLPIGHWQDILVENGMVTAVPFLSDDDDFAMKIFRKIEEGTIRMASAGLDPKEATDAPEMMLEGQTLPTLTKCIMYEASIADMAVNNNALALHFKGKTIDLAAGEATAVLQTLSTTPKTVIKSTSNMNPVLQALAVQLGIKDPTEALVAEAMQKKLTELTTLSTQVETLGKEKDQLQTKIDALELSAKSAKIEGMLTLAINEGRITAAEKPALAKLAENDFDAVEQLVKAKPAHATAQSRLAAETGEGDPLLKLSWDEAHKAGKLETIQAKFPDHYKTLFKSKFGHEPK